MAAKLTRSTQLPTARAINDSGQVTDAPTLPVVPAPWFRNGFLGLSRRKR